MISYVTTGDSWDGPGHNQVTALGLTVSLGLQRLLSVGLFRLQLLALSPQDRAELLPQEVLALRIAIQEPQRITRYMESVALFRRMMRKRTDDGIIMANAVESTTVCRL